MNKRSFAILSFCLLAALSSTFSYSQKTPSPGQVLKDDSQLYSGRIMDYWNHRIVKCGDSSYFFRTGKGGRNDLYEVKGVTFETKGEITPRPAAGTKRTPEDIEYPRSVDWSGSSVAKFESHRKFISRDLWEDWKSGGSEFSYFQVRKASLFYTPGWPEFTSCSEVESFKKRIAAGALLPDIIANAGMKDGDGRTFTLDDYKDKVVLLNLWATWCGPCLLQEPELVELQDKYGEKGLVVIGLNVDGESKEIIDAYRKRLKINFITATSGENLLSDLIGIAGMNAIPQTFLLHNGKLIEIFKGYTPTSTKAKMEAAIKNALNEQ